MHTKLFIIDFLCVVNLLLFISDSAVYVKFFCSQLICDDYFFIRHNLCHLLKITAECKLSVRLSVCLVPSPCPSLAELIDVLRLLFYVCTFKVYANVYRV